MKVCMLSTMYLRYKNDTRGLMVYETSKNLLKESIDVSVVAPNDVGFKKFQVLDGIKVHRFNYFWPKKLQKLAYGSGIPTQIRKSFLAKLQVIPFFISFLLKAIKVSKKCDVMHCQWIETGLIGILAKKLNRKPVVVTVRRISKKGFMKSITKYVLKNSDYVVFNSNYTMKECLKIQKPKKYNVVWNSVDENKFRPIKTNLKKKLNLKNKKILFSLGLLVEKKGFKYLIKAMPEIIKKHKDVVLLIGGHGKEENKLRKIVKELDLKNYVRFVEKIEADKTPHYYNACDIFVLPSIIDSKGETETLGVVLLEAMACAKPVVASNVGGIPDVVKKESGILVQQKNPKQIAEKINLLLSNEKLRKKMGIKGRNRIMQKFSWKATGQRLIKIYEELSNKI